MVNDHISPSSVLLPNLPEEIITIILLKLPVRSLLKFSCVSKTWLSLISSSHFKKTHLKISADDSDDRLICAFNDDNDSAIYTCPLPFRHDDESVLERVPFQFDCLKPCYAGDNDDQVRFNGSCNGLVCMVYFHNIVLWNPASRASRLLPHSGTDFKDLISASVVYGFGYDSSSDDYKVTEVTSDDYEPFGGTQCRVYSLRADEWRSLDWPGGKLRSKQGVFLNGAIHWEIISGFDFSKWEILTLDATDETFTCIEFPDRGSSWFGTFLGVSEGARLVCGHNYADHTDIWMLNEYGVPESWTKLVLVPYDQLSDDWVSDTRPLLVLRSGAILFEYSGGLVMYDPINQHRILISHDRSGVRTATYRESLISPCLVVINPNALIQMI